MRQKSTPLPHFPLLFTYQNEHCYFLRQLFNIIIKQIF